MMTALRQTATVTAQGRLDVAVPELTPGTLAEVIVLVAAPASPPAASPSDPAINSRLAALRQLQDSLNLSAEDVRKWQEDVRQERLAWRLPGDVEP